MPSRRLLCSLLPALALLLLPASVLAVCAGGTTYDAGGCSGYGGSVGCCNLERTALFWCETVDSASGAEVTCVADCGGASCGWDGDVSYPLPIGEYRCGQAAQPEESGYYPWTCDALCSASCGGKICGDDGCGGTCGACYSDPQSACPTVCIDGACDKACADCEALGWTCGNNCCGGTCGSCTPPSVCDPASHTCSCIPDCGGKICGDDGCDGACGVCAAGQVCEDGACVIPPPEPEPEVVDPPDGASSDVQDAATPPDASVVDTGAPPADTGAPSPDTGAPSPDAGAPASDTAGAVADWWISADAGEACPAGYSPVYGVCTKDPPTSRPEEGGGGCGVGRTHPSALALVWLALGLILWHKMRHAARPHHP
jgi:hypothetical protein